MVLSVNYLGILIPTKHNNVSYRHSNLNIWYVVGRDVHKQNDAFLGRVYMFQDNFCLFHCSSTNYNVIYISLQHRVVYLDCTMHRNSPQPFATANNSAH